MCEVLLSIWAFYEGLARLGLLDRFHYLSTVSGGGYIGSWLGR